MPAFRRWWLYYGLQTRSFLLRGKSFCVKPVSTVRSLSISFRCFGWGVGRTRHAPFAGAACVMGDRCTPSCPLERFCLDWTQLRVARLPLIGVPPRAPFIAHRPVSRYGLRGGPRVPFLEHIQPLPRTLCLLWLFCSSASWLSYYILNFRL